MNIYQDYDKIIIGVTEDKPRIIPPQKVKIIFESVLRHLPKFKVMIVKGTIENNDSLDNLPEFDILLSGNMNVINHVKKFGINAQFMPRSKGIGYSGTEIRKIAEKSDPSS